MLVNTLISFLMILITTVIHAFGMILVFRAIRSQEGHMNNDLRRKQIVWTSGTVLLMFIVSFAEVTVWAIAYLLTGAIEGFEHALYFSMVTFTTLGYGDIVLNENWRLLGSLQAANGIIMFGWTTAIVVASVHHIFLSKISNTKNDQEAT